MTDQETGLEEIIKVESITIIIEMCNRAENPKFFFLKDDVCLLACRDYYMVSGIESFSFI